MKRWRVLAAMPRRWWRALALALVLHALLAAVLVAVVSIGFLHAPRRPRYVVAALLPSPAAAPAPQPVEPPPVPERAPGPPAAATNAMPALGPQSPSSAIAEGAAADAIAAGGAPIQQDESPTVPPLQTAPAAHADPAAPAQQDLDARRQWEIQVLEHLEKYKRYPALAQQRRQQDRVLLGIRVDRGGQVLDLRIVESAGFALLDDEAVDLARRASPLPAPPEAVPEHELDFVVAIEFHIENRSDALW